MYTYISTYIHTRILYACICSPCAIHVVLLIMYIVVRSTRSSLQAAGRQKKGGKKNWKKKGDKSADGETGANGEAEATATAAAAADGSGSDGEDSN